MRPVKPDLGHLREAALIGVALIAIALLEYEGFIDKRRNRGDY